jgi:hypothetical protein
MGVVGAKILPFSGLSQRRLAKNGRTANRTIHTPLQIFSNILQLVYFQYVLSFGEEKKRGAALYFQ